MAQEMLAAWMAMSAHPFSLLSANISLNSYSNP